VRRFRKEADRGEGEGPPGTATARAADKMGTPRRRGGNQFVSPRSKGGVTPKKPISGETWGINASPGTGHFLLGADKSVAQLGQGTGGGGRMTGRPETGMLGVFADSPRLSRQRTSPKNRRADARCRAADRQGAAVKREGSRCMQTLHT